MVNKLNEAAQKNRESFTSTRWSIDQTTSSPGNMVPGFLLVGKRLQPFGGQPFPNDPESYGIVVFQVLQFTQREPVLI